MNEIAKIFKFSDKDSVRCVERNGDPWFVAQDVCRVLKVRDVNQATSRLSEDERGWYNLPTPGGQQRFSIISEPGLYTIMLRANGALDETTLAGKFRRWVTHEVLPSIRKKGAYVTDRYSPAQHLADVTMWDDNRTAAAKMREHLQVAWVLRQGMLRVHEIDKPIEKRCA